MIDFTDISSSKPYKKFKLFYDKAMLKNQSAIEALAISSFNNNLKEVESRFVNLKYIINNEWIFFSNYKSNKAMSFESHNQISALFYWDSINTQIRIKAIIKKSSVELSDTHFKNRSIDKNVLAISSSQSSIISSYDEVIIKYNNALNKKSLISARPDYWGGYSFIPYSFEFWEGHKSRLNKRDLYEIKESKWTHHILEP